MKKISPSIILTVIYLIIFLLVFGFSIVQQFKTEGFSNATIYSNAEIKEEVDPDTNRTVIRGIFTSDDNYLGAINVSANLANIYKEGTINFRLKESGQNEWHSSNSYNIYSLGMLKVFPFGIETIKNSADKTYIFQLDSKDIDLKNSNIFPTGQTTIATRHVYEKSVLSTDKSLFIKIAFYKITNAINSKLFLLLSFIIMYPFFYFFTKKYITLKTKTQKPNLELLDNMAQDLFKIRLNLFYIVAVLFLTIVCCLIFKQESLALKLAPILFLLVIASVIQKMYSTIEKEVLLQKVKKLFTTKKIIISVFILVLISSLTPYYQLGGDDTRLFYRYPTEYFNNFTLKLGSDSAISGIKGHIPTVVVAPFIALLIFSKTILPFINVQALFYNLNFILAAYFFYKLLQKLLPNSTHNKVIFGFASIMYISSIFHIYTFYSAKLIAVYLLSIVPFSLYFLIRSLEEKKFYLLIPVLLVMTFFSTLAASAPWMLATIISLIPLFIWLFIKHKMRFIKYGIIFGILTILLNINWMFYIPQSTLVNNDSASTGSSISSNDFRQENAAGIKIVSEHNNLAYPVLNLYHYEIQRNFNWPNLALFREWFLPLLPLNAVLLIIILLPALNRKKGSQLSVYITCTFSLLTALYFFTVNIDWWGIPFFVWLNNEIPGFVMFRNMYDKFGNGLSITYALTLAISVVMVLQNKYKYISRIILILFVITVLLNAKPFLNNQEYNHNTIWTTKETYPTTTDFNNDYWDLINYLKQQPKEGRILSLPLNHGNLSLIQDRNLNNHYYVGVSPLLIMADRNDFSGLLSFGLYGPEIKEHLRNKEYDKVGKILQTLNVQYIVTNNSISEDLLKSYLFSDGLLESQTYDFYNELLGAKVKDFGGRYSLYRINQLYDSKKIALTNNPQSSITYVQTAGHKYDVSISNIENSGELTFAEPFDQNWQLQTKDGEVIANSIHQKYLGFSNSWSLNKSENNITNKELTIFYKPYKYFNFVNSIVVITILILFGYFSFAVFKDQKNKK